MLIPKGGPPVWAGGIVLFVYMEIKLEQFRWNVPGRGGGVRSNGLLAELTPSEPWHDLARLPWHDPARLPWLDLARLPWHDLARLPWHDLARLPWLDPARLPWLDPARLY
eukprot:1148253-Pelagomonas_calceolata.AAC.4